MEIREYLAWLQVLQTAWENGINTESKLRSFMDEALMYKNGETNLDEFRTRVDANVKIDDPILKEPALIRQEILSALTASPVRQRIIKTYREHGHIGSIASKVKADDVYYAASALEIPTSAMLQYDLTQFSRSAIKAV